MAEQDRSARPMLKTLDEVRERFREVLTVQEACGLIHACADLVYPHKPNGERLHELFAFLRTIGAEADGDFIFSEQEKREARIIMARTIVKWLTAAGFNDSPVLIKYLLDFYAADRAHSLVPQTEHQHIMKFIEECWKNSLRYWPARGRSWFEEHDISVATLLRAMAKTRAIDLIFRDQVIGVIPDLYEDAVAEMQKETTRPLPSVPKALSWLGWRKFFGATNYCAPMLQVVRQDSEVYQNSGDQKDVIDRDVRCVFLVVGMLNKRRVRFTNGEPVPLEEEFKLLLSLTASFELLRYEWARPRESES